LAAKKKRRTQAGIIKKGWKIFFSVILFLVILTILQVFCLKFVNPSFTFHMAFLRIQEMITGKIYHQPSWFWKDLKEISPHLRKAVLAAEDQRFPDHYGFDFVEIKQVVKDMLDSKRIRGASTISMQSARSLFLLNKRSLLRKSLEAYYTFLIELFWTKERILEVYLNTVDWGTGVLGAEAAARKYFNISSSDINELQAASLAAILPSPHRWSPSGSSPQVHWRIQKILNDMKYMPLI
jgi:monofunctional biosynthetic peptidoglycan transglycosylase